VQIIPSRPIISPRQAERLMSALWQQSAGSTLALFLLGRGDGRPVLGAASPNPLIEEDAAEVIARAVGTAVEPGFVLVEEVMSAPHVGVRHITPVFRGFKSDSASWGWDRADNLHDTYDMLRRVPPGRIAGFALAFRTLPGLVAATSMLVFAASAEAHESQRAAYALAATYAGTGARVARLLNPRRFLRRTLRAQVATSVSWLRPHSVIRVEEMSAFWHPRLSEQKTGVDDLPF
jgi:hypothetical protein